MKQYRIIGRFAKEEKMHVIDNSFKTYQEAQRRIKELEREQEQERKKGGRFDTVGSIGVITKYNADYELKDMKIQSREVTPWTDATE